MKSFLGKLVPLAVKTWVARWGVKQAVNLGFEVLPARRALATQYHAELLEQLVKSKGPQFRNREVRRAALQHLGEVSGNIRLGRSEIETFVKEGGLAD